MDAKDAKSMLESAKTGKKDAPARKHYADAIDAAKRIAKEEGGVESAWGPVNTSRAIRFVEIVERPTKREHDRVTFYAIDIETGRTEKELSSAPCPSVLASRLEKLVKNDEAIVTYLGRKAPANATVDSQPYHLFSVAKLSDDGSVTAINDRD